MSFDSKSRELAEYYLPSRAPEQLKDELTQYIQDAIEAWLKITAEKFMQIAIGIRQGKEPKL